VITASPCPACGRVNPDGAARCDCGYVVPTAAAAGAAAFRPAAALGDLAWAALAVAGAGVAVWGIARASPSVHRAGLMLVVVVPQVLMLQAVLRRRCYPNTTFRQMCRWGTLSPLDPVPAPVARKAYVAVLGGAQVGFAILLAYVILARTWAADRLGLPQTSLFYDVLHPGSVAPLYQIDTVARPADARPPTPVAWWVFPGLGAVVFPFLMLAWCGTLERTAHLARHRPTTQQAAYPELSGARVAAIMAVLLFWLSLIGLAAGAVACWLTRRSAGWTPRVIHLGLAASAVVHAILAALVILDTMRW